MAEAMAMDGSKSTGKSGKIALKELTQSPGRYLLSPNDDSFERRQARLARAAAAQKRRSLAFGEAQQERPADPGILSSTQVRELLNNCIKLAAENKINQQNTWDLKLIDYLPDILKGENAEDTQTNFQKASCTLEASAKIYSCRVDSVHTETYKVLGGLHRSVAPGKQKNTNDNDDEENGGEDHGDEQEARKKDSHKKVETLESFENLNVKHFDASLHVDPLFHLTSAQFDEGGAKGLLLNTLSVYRGCEILFDSQDVPEKCMKLDLPKDPPVIDLSFASDILEQICSERDAEISPSLREILELLEDPFRKAAAVEEEETSPAKDDTGWFDQCNDEVEPDNDTGEVFDGDQSGIFGDNEESISPAADHSWTEENDDEVPESNGFHNESNGVQDAYNSDGTLPELTIEWLREGLGIPNRKNTWAGPDYWKFVKPRAEAAENNEPVKKETKRRKKEQFSLVYTSIPEFDPGLFAKPRDLRSTLLPNSRQPASTTLPEDLHYKADDLLRVFLRPSVVCVRGRLKRSEKSSRFSPEFDGDEAAPPAGDYFWDQGDVVDDPDDDLIAQPRKVNKIQVNYDRTSKQVDVRVLKETLWEFISEAAKQEPDGESDAGELHFSELLGRIPETCPAAAPEDLSVHLCFICLLHLANEHNLVINGTSAMNDLIILQNSNSSDEE